MKLEVRTGESRSPSRASIWMALLGTRGRNGHLRIFIMFYLFSIYLFILPYHVNMYNLISSELPVKVDSIN